jgi:hypothetical protein
LINPIATAQVLTGNVQNESAVFRANTQAFYNGVYALNQTFFNQV